MKQKAPLLLLLVFGIDSGAAFRSLAWGAMRTPVGVDYSLCLAFIKPTEKMPFDTYRSRFFNLDPQGIVTVNEEMNKENFAAMSGGKPIFLGKPINRLDSTLKPGTDRVQSYELIFNQSKTSAYMNEKVRFFRDDQGRVTTIQVVSRNNSGSDPFEDVYQINFIFPGDGTRCFPQREATQRFRRPVDSPIVVQTVSSLEECRTARLDPKVNSRCEKYADAVAAAKGLGDLRYSELTGTAAGGSDSGLRAR
jgi:hypothetical protein